MSIQQNVNQLLAMTGTAMMLSPGIRQKAEDRSALRKLGKEEKNLQTLQKESMSKEAKLERAHRQGRIANLQEKLKTETNEKLIEEYTTELSALTKAEESFKTDIAARFDRLADIAEERLMINPSKENIEEYRAYQNTKNWKDVLTERKQRKKPQQTQSKEKAAEAMEHMVSGGQAMLEQKNAFRDLVNTVGGKNE